MGAATLLIFVAVVHRYAAGMPIPVVQDPLLKIDLSWAQELCIYMFVWMAKFGAAYGVRTGIHVGVDVLINRLPGATRKAYVLFGLLAGATFTRHRRHARREVHLGDRADRARRRPTSRCRSGSSISASRSARTSCASASCRSPGISRRTGELPQHDVAHVEGIDDDADINPYNLADNLHPADVRPEGRP